MSIIVTGGAGFIGSCIVSTLNSMGIEDIIVVDNIASTDKWRNLNGKRYREYIQKDRFSSGGGLELTKLAGQVSHIIHMGACSSTTEKNFDYLYCNNFEFTKMLWRFCADNGVSFIYASSAATYGDGRMGFDDKTDIRGLLPMNGYGYSKQLFDLWAEKQKTAPPQHVGFKFFNVYGPNEYYKGSMASVILHGYRSAMQDGVIRLFKSYKDGIEDGGQLRDFVYVKDICSAVMFMMEHPEVSGLFNLGTGKARSFRDLGEAVFSALQLEPNIEYIEMPESLRAKYQYYTQADISKLRSSGYKKDFWTLEDGVRDYVTNYLQKDYVAM